MNASSASLVATASLAAGTELIVERLAYRHHGIYLGDGLVIHYAGRTRYRHGLIETIPLQDFAGIRRVHVGRVPNEALQGEAIVRRARSRLGECHYDIFRNNCEHFCSWCHVGEDRSEQVDLFLQRIQAVRCTVRRMVPRCGESNLKRRLRFIAQFSSMGAKHLLPFPPAALPGTTEWQIAGATRRGRQEWT